MRAVQSLPGIGANTFHLTIFQVIWLVMLSSFTTRVHVDANISKHQLMEMFSWKMLDFNWPNDAVKRDGLSNGTYVPENVILGGIQVWKDVIFVSVPRYRPGVPVTLAMLNRTSVPTEPSQGISRVGLSVSSHGQSGVITPSNKTMDKWDVKSSQGNANNSPTLEAFPSWEMQQIENCHAFQSVQNMEVDPVGRLWVVDAGRLNTLTRYHVSTKCPPKLVIFDLVTRKEIRRYEIPEDVASRCTNYLSDLVLDLSQGTDDAFAYITDAGEGSIVVYDYKNNKSWESSHPSMKLDMNNPEVDISGQNYTFDLGAGGIAISPLKNGSKEVYYNTLTRDVYKIPSVVLRNESAARGDIESSHIVKALGKKKSMADSILIDDKGDFYFGGLSEFAIYRWNSSYHNFTSESQEIVAQNPGLLQWVHSLAIDEEGYLWITTNVLHEYMARKMNMRKTNFRILRLYIGSRPYWSTGAAGESKESNEGSILHREELQELAGDRNARTESRSGCSSRDDEQESRNSTEQKHSNATTPVPSTNYPPRSGNVARDKPIADASNIHQETKKPNDLSTPTTPTSNPRTSTTPNNSSTSTSNPAHENNEIKRSGDEDAMAWERRQHKSYHHENDTEMENRANSSEIFASNSTTTVPTHRNISSSPSSSHNASSESHSGSVAKLKSAEDDHATSPKPQKGSEGNSTTSGCIRVEYQALVLMGLVLLSTSIRSTSIDLDGRLSL